MSKFEFQLVYSKAQMYNQCRTKIDGKNEKKTQRNKKNEKNGIVIEKVGRN